MWSKPPPPLSPQISPKRVNKNRTGYAGVQGNERVVRLAGLATTLESQLLDHADIIHNLRDIERVEDCAGSELIFLRLHELGVKIRTARNERYCRRSRGIMNQYWIGIFSCIMLLDLVRGRL